MMAVLIIDFVSMAVFLRNCLGFSRLPSAVGGFLFAFGSPRPAQLGHQQLLPQFFTIFALHGLFRFFEPRKMSAKQGIHVFFLSSPRSSGPGSTLAGICSSGCSWPRFGRCACAGIAGRFCTFFYSPVQANRELPPQYQLHIDAKWAALQTGIPTINGYSGNFPKGWWDLWDNRVLDEPTSSRMRDALQKWSTTHGIDRTRVCWIRSP